MRAASFAHPPPQPSAAPRGEQPVESSGVGAAHAPPRPALPDDDDRRQLLLAASIATSLDLGPAPSQGWAEPWAAAKEVSVMEAVTGRSPLGRRHAPPPVGR